MPNIPLIAGVPELWKKTLGDPAVRIAIIDGPVDLTHPCFDGALLRQVDPYWQNGRPAEKHYVQHATHVASVIFGQHGSNVTGVAPKCRGLSIPALRDDTSGLSVVDLVRALDDARDAGAHIVHVAACHPTVSGRADPLLERAVRACIENDILVVAPAGNDKGECWCVPAVLPGVLVAGAMTDDGVPFRFSNFGGPYEGRGVLAPGENILGAESGGGTARHKGTSCAAPIVTGIAGLLMSLQLQEGQPLDASKVRAAILESSKPCDQADSEECQRWMLGKLDVTGAVNTLLTGFARTFSEGIECRYGPVAAPETEPVASSKQPQLATYAGRARRVFALGTLGYDFGTESRLDTFKRQMAPADPFDVPQMAQYLGNHGSEARSLIWTLNQDRAPIYAIEPLGVFGDEVYDVFRQLLADQVEPGDRHIDQVSLPGILSDTSETLLSGQVVPIVESEHVRGLCGWNVDALIGVAIEALRANQPVADEEALRGALSGFLRRVYFGLPNAGLKARDRALNFSGTNVFQAASVFTEAVALGMSLATIAVERSTFCRPDSDCWDVKLKFFDPEKFERSCRVSRFTIDVVDTLPVTVGDIRSWWTSS